MNISMNTSKKILIVGPAWVGDLVMAQSLFITLKQQMPDCIIDVMAPAWGQAILARMPQVRRAITLPLGHGEFQLKQRYQFAQSLRPEHYDQAIVLPNSWKSALIPFFAGIPQRTGWRGEMRYGLLNDCRTLDKARYPLMIERFIALAFPKNILLPQPLAKPALIFNPENLNKTLAELNLSNKQRILVLAPGAEFGPAKQWPAQHYAQTAQHYLKLGWQVWILGSAKDQTVAEAIQQPCQHQCINLTGKTNLGQAVDLIAQADLVISNDSGLMHIASATARPTVVIYGSSSPGFTPPLADQVRILTLNLDCSPCFQRVCPLGHTNCLNHLQPQQVLRAAAELVAS